jgi:hypothetical protein
MLNVCSAPVNGTLTMPESDWAMVCLLLAWIQIKKQSGYLRHLEN